MEKNSVPRIYGLIGYPVKHSLSPTMQNAAFATLKLNAQYRLFEVKPEELADFLLSDKPACDINGNLIPKSSICGFNVTIPHKVKARQILEKKFPLDKNKKQIPENEYYVKLSGAVNTIKRDKNKILYYNTDASGFLKSLEQDLKFQPKGKVVLIFGCGGAGRAIIAALSWINVGINKIYVHDIDRETVSLAQKHFAEFKHLENKLYFIPNEEIPTAVKECDLLINATAVGMKEGDSTLAEKSLLHKNLSIYDVVYNRQTQLIKDAKSLGLPNTDGLSMLLYQGVDALNLWLEPFPIQAPIEIMRKALTEAAGR